MSVVHAQTREELPAPALEELSDGIFAYIQLDGSWFLNNTGFVTSPDGVIVIDSTGTESRAKAFHAAVRGQTDLPLRALINTHSHGDHTFGNFVFTPDCAIVGQELCREAVLATDVEGTKQRFPGGDFGEIEIAAPFLTFEERMNVYAGDLKIELIHMGPAHTPNDIVAWIPERKVLFAGDLIFNQGTPFALQGSVNGWLVALDRMETLRPETIVPGHGPVAGPEVIGDVRNYLRFIANTARAGFEADIEPRDLARDLDLGEFAELHDPERVVPNLHRAYSELRGEPLGTPLPALQMFDEMVEYNGGQPLRCLA